MKRSRPTDLGVSITRFFEEYLPGQRGMSVHTIRSYRDAVVLMLQFIARECRRGVEQLSIKDFTAERVLSSSSSWRPIGTTALLRAMLGSGLFTCSHGSSHPSDQNIWPRCNV